MRDGFRTFLLDDGAATAIEYAMIAAFIFLAIVAAVPLLGRAVSDKFDFVAKSFPG